MWTGDGLIYIYLAKYANVMAPERKIFYYGLTSLPFLFLGMWGQPMELSSQILYISFCVSITSLSEGQWSFQTDNYKHPTPPVKIRT